MHLSHFLFLPWITGICYFMTGPYHCFASQKKTACEVQNGSADCSHLTLNAIPTNLPRNLTSLDMSHNRLVHLPPSSLSLYPVLLHLDVGYNSITKLEEGLCQTLVLLQTLNVEHNEVHVLTEKDLNYCTNLTRLNMAGNRLKLEGEPFFSLQSLIFLDVSKNKLTFANLGSRPQLPRLENMTLSYNDITTLRKDDFSYLSRSSSLRTLDLSGLPLKKFESGCFKPIASIHTLIMDGNNLGTPLLYNLSSQLSGTAISRLSLQKTSLVTLTNKTFQGLEKTNLTILDLSNNGMGKIEDGSFRWLSRLEMLILEDNNLKHVTKATFQGLKSLKKLHLKKALVKSHTSSTPIIDPFSFQPLSALESLMLPHCAIREITENTFSGLTSLHDLDLSWCTCTTLKSISNNTFVSLAASPLRMLNLTAAAMTRIDPGAFSILGNLTTLLLDLNFIKQTLAGKEFQGLHQLEELFFSNNHQTIMLSSTSFVHLPNLRTLTLGRSLTSTLDLDPSPFKPLTNLTFLDISNNNIANINAVLLDGLVKLKVLKLNHNNLARVWKSANRGGPVLFLKGLQSLTALEMDYNGLDEIPLQALRELNNLHELNLGGNVLNSLKDTVFDDLQSLRVLRLEKNLITAVRPEVFKTAMSNLSLLVMDRNPFDCTCESILWFATWMNRTNATILGPRNQYMCNTPLAYFNHTIMDFDPLSCKDMTPFQALYILSCTAVITLMVAALLVRFHGWRIQFYWNILINRTLGFSDAKVEEGREFEYDAYVIHAEEDVRWVERSLLPLEDEKYTFCLEDRDSVPGMSRLESIMENMNKARKILFVVTESLLKDQWCRRFKVHHALHQVIEASRDSVVLVFLQDVHDYRLSQALFLRRGMLRLRCILHWPVHKERVPAFRQKLRIALGLTNRLQ
ncbi:toll-like receptor 3 [Polymixia lowei]